MQKPRTGDAGLPRTLPAPDNRGGSSSTNKIATTQPWRDVLPVHPAAELFPPMSPDDLRTLGEDIIKNGLTSPIALWRADPKAPEQLLDGRNRLDAIEMMTGCQVIVGPPSLMAGEDFVACDKVIVLDKSVDPYAYVISANIHRRHLTAEKKRELVAELIKQQPNKSDRQIAEQAKSNRTTVGQIRKGLENTGDVSIVDTRTDRKGRKQPTKRKSPRRPASPIGLGDQQPVIDVPPDPEKAGYPSGYESPWQAPSPSATPEPATEITPEVAPPPPIEKQEERSESVAQPQPAPPIAATAEDDIEYVTGVMVRDWIVRFTDCGLALNGVARWIEEHPRKLSRADIDRLRKYVEAVSNEAMKLISKLSDGIPDFLRRPAP
jgi:hypothetical protein